MGFRVCKEKPELGRGVVVCTAHVPMFICMQIIERICLWPKHVLSKHTLEELLPSPQPNFLSLVHFPASWVFPFILEPWKHSVFPLPIGGK